VVGYGARTPLGQLAGALAGNRRVVHAIVLAVGFVLIPTHLPHFQAPRAASALPVQGRIVTPGRWDVDTESRSPLTQPVAPAERNPRVEVDPQPGIDLDHATTTQLQRELEANRAEQVRIHAELAVYSARIEALNEQVRQLDGQIADREKRIQVERRQARALARAIYVQPSSAVLALAQSENLGEFMTRTSNLAAANARARETAVALEADQKRLQTEQAGASSARDQQVAVRGDLQARLRRYQQMEAREQELIAYWARQAQVQAQQARVSAGPAGIQDLIREAFQPLGSDVVGWALRVAACESGFNPNAVNSWSGAMGLFQFMPSTWARSPFAGQDPFDPRVNAKAAAWLYQRSGPGQWDCK
jgi:hypothetical protein